MTIEPGTSDDAATDRPSPVGPRRAALLAMALGLLVGAGCGETEGPPPFRREETKVADLPATVIGAAKKRLPRVDFEEAWKNLDRDGQLQSYEVRGREPSGKIREVRVSVGGEILEME